MYKLLTFHHAHTHARTVPIISRLEREIHRRANSFIRPIIRSSSSCFRLSYTLPSFFLSLSSLAYTLRIYTCVHSWLTFPLSLSGRDLSLGFAVRIRAEFSVYILGSRKEKSFLRRGKERGSGSVIGRVTSFFSHPRCSSFLRILYFDSLDSYEPIIALDFFPFL